MMLHDKIHRPGSLFQQPVQFAHRVFEQTEVIQINVQNNRHRVTALLE